MPSLAMPRLVAASLLLVCACSASPRRAGISAPSLPFVAIVVAPARLDFRGTPYEAYLRNEDVLATLWRDTTVLALSPAEVEQRRPGLIDLLRGSDLVLRQQALGIEPRRVGLLTTTVGLREAHTAATTLGPGEARAAAFAASSELVVTLRLHDARGGLVLERQERRTLDPFAEHPSYDPRPELRQMLRALVNGLVDSCVDCFTEWDEGDPALVQNPASVFVRAGRYRALESMDELDRDQELMRVMLYFEEEMPLLEARWLFSLGGGFCAAEATDELAEGDCVTHINGQPVDGPHALRRLLARGTPLELTVARRGEPVRQVTYPRD